MRSRVKVIRRLGTPLPGLTRKPADRRPYPPGVHGATARLRKSDYRSQLEEKQKVRFHYGVSETQLRRSLAKTADLKADRRRTRLELLERRLDNVVFRLGWAPTIPAARQLVTHGHVRVNGRQVDRPGYTSKPVTSCCSRSGRAGCRQSRPRSKADLNCRCRATSVGTPNLIQAAWSDNRHAATSRSMSMRWR
jgi:ribosomal protein S4